MMRLRLLLTGAILALLFLLQPLDMAARPTHTAGTTMAAASAPVPATRPPSLAVTIDLRPGAPAQLATRAAPPAFAATAGSDRPGPGGRLFAY